MTREDQHARFVAQIYAEAAVSLRLAEVVGRQLAAMRAAIAELVPDPQRHRAAQIAEAFVSLCIGYNQQLAIRGDLDPAPFAAALMAIIRE